MSRRGLGSQSKIMTVLSWIFVFLLIGAAGFLVYEAIQIGIFSSTQLMIGGGVLAVLVTLFACLLIRRFEHNWTKAIVIVLSLAMVCVCGFGGYYLEQTGDFFTMVSGGGDSDESGNSQDDSVLNSADVLNQMAMSVTTYAMHESNITKPSELNGKVVGVITAQDEKGTRGALEQLASEGGKPETQEYADPYTLVDALYANEVDAIVFPEQFHEEILDIANDFNKYNALTTFTNIVDQYIYYEPVPEEMKNPADPVADVTKDPFTVLISGSDSYGNLSPTSRSDVNMLVTVNPGTHQILMVSIPRDTYLTISCKKNATACAAVDGAPDKLTHTGIYGIGTTESSIEDFMDVDINYTVRVNFSSLINIVDAIGGIDVEVEPGLEVDTFYANGTKGVEAGMNHLEGERALAFARERHAYVAGDNQRVINQQIVMKALLNKMMSPSMVVYYPGFIRALSTAFTTNMPSRQIKALIGLEISSFPDWNIQSFALSGDSDTMYCSSLGNYASVTLTNEAQVEQARNLIDDVLDGQTIDTTSSQQPASEDVSSQSSRHNRHHSAQDQSSEESVTNEFEYPGYEQPTYDQPAYDQPEPEPTYPVYPEEPDETPYYPQYSTQPSYPDGASGADASQAPNTQDGNHEFQEADQ